MVKKCPTCNADNRGDARFCSACGQSLVSPQPTPPLKPSPTVKTVSYSGHAYPGVPGSTAPTPTRIPQSGMCFYHTSLPAVYVCNRCGKPICHDDAKRYGDLIVCPQCYPLLPPPATYPQPPMPPPPPPF